MKKHLILSAVAALFLLSGCESYDQIDSAAKGCSNPRTDSEDLNSVSLLDIVAAAEFVHSPSLNGDVEAVRFCYTRAYKFLIGRQALIDEAKRHVRAQ